MPDTGDSPLVEILRGFLALDGFRFCFRCVAGTEVDPLPGASAGCESAPPVKGGLSEGAPVREPLRRSAACCTLREAAAADAVLRTNALGLGSAAAQHNGYPSHAAAVSVKSSHSVHTVKQHKNGTLLQ